MCVKYYELWVYVIKNSGFKKTRVFFKKPNPAGFFGFYWVLLGIWVLLGFFYLNEHITLSAVYVK